MSKNSIIVLVLSLLLTASLGYIGYDYYSTKIANKNDDNQVNQNTTNNENKTPTPVTPTPKPVETVKDPEVVTKPVRNPMYWSSKYSFGFDYPSTYKSVAPTSYGISGPTVDYTTVLTYKDSKVYSGKSGMPRGFVVNVVKNVTSFSKFISNEVAGYNAMSDINGEGQATTKSTVKADGVTGYKLNTFDYIDRYYFPIPNSKNVLAISMAWAYDDTSAIKKVLYNKIPSSIIFSR